MPTSLSDTDTVAKVTNVYDTKSESNGSLRMSTIQIKGETKDYKF